MTKKRTPYSSKRTTKKSKRDESTPKAVRFSTGQLPIVEGVVKVLRNKYPSERVTVNKFIVSATMYFVKMNQKAVEQQMSLFPGKRQNDRLKTKRVQRERKAVNKKPVPVKIAE